jgi:plasmid stability protein
MAQVIVRNIEEGVKASLKARASEHGWSMEEEVRQILRRAVSMEDRVRPKLGSRIAARFADAGLTAPLPELRGQNMEPMGFGA